MTILFAALHQQMEKAFKLGIRNCFIIMRTIDGNYSVLISLTWLVLVPNVTKFLAFSN